MLVNEKKYKRKEPENVALELTIAHSILFSDKDMTTVIEREGVQAQIDLELENVAQQLAYKEDANKKMSQYVR